jgi:valyl-tRNA synthetase
MSEISKAYEPQSVESKWYQFWLDRNCFAADPHSTKPAYSIVIPPPNVTGVLTLGHVLNNTIQDILARKARMDGKEVLWLPGTDHAGIATENVVLRQLRKEEHKAKQDIGREEFLKRVWTWKEKHGGIILQQLKALGASCDWTRTRFTMDEHYKSCVTRVFVDLYKKGFIYRGKRMVNWCPATLTALSDEEVIMKEQKGFMYHFKVEVVEQPGTFLTIATTRPETIPADTAVAVNPKDPRYTHLIGKHVYRALPLDVSKEQRVIPIIADEHVDFEFGTGVLKVTPAHDKADFDIGLRHKLPVIDALTPDGKMTTEAGAELAGLDRFAARKKAAEIMEAAGSLEKAEPYVNNVGFSERADVPIEPRLSEQWFLKYPSVEEAKNCVAQEGSATVPVADSGVPPESPSAREASASSGVVARSPVGGTPTGAGGTPALPGKMHFYPQRWAKVYDHWMTGIQDWCISRQLWWGHRIPVWMKNYPDRLAAVNDEDEINRLTRQRKEFVVRREPEVKFAEDNDEPCRVYVCVAPDESADSDQANVIRAVEALGFTQDPDVLDTWFSSWLWPFATMGWPESTDTLKKFYPTTDLVTGPDIIFFWVARMIMAGYEWMGEMPFRNVYFTGIIRDKQGRKMSKSLGNSPDPLDLINTYGADALRFGIMRSAPQGQDLLFDEQSVELGRNFCNKLWNACRFRQMQGGEAENELRPELLTSDDKWILLKLDQAIREVTDALNNYKFNEAANALYRFFWSEYCDWYVEASKAVLQAPIDPNNPRSAARRENTLAVIDFVLSHTLRLFHPFLPFITEELWQGMGFSADLPKDQGGDTIMFANWPKAFDTDFRDHYAIDDCYLERVENKYEVVRVGRNLRREGRIAGNVKVKFVLKPLNDLPPHDIEVIKLLLNAESLEVNAEYQPPKASLRGASPLGELYLPLEGLIDVADEKARREKELAKIAAEIEKVAAKLANPSFTQKVPPQVLREHEQRLADWNNKHAQVKAALDALGS